MQTITVNGTENKYSKGAFLITVLYRFQKEANFRGQAINRTYFVKQQVGRILKFLSNK